MIQITEEKYEALKNIRESAKAVVMAKEEVDDGRLDFVDREQIAKLLNDVNLKIVNLKKDLARMEFLEVLHP